MPYSIWCRGRFIGEEQTKREAFATAKLAAQLDRASGCVMRERGRDEADMIADVSEKGEVKEFNQWRHS
jgi:hypothetical protein